MIIKIWLRYALVLSVLIASHLHARVDIIDVSAKGSRIEYRPDGMRSSEVGATHLVGVPPAGKVWIEQVEAFTADGRAIAIGQSGPWASIAGEGMVRRQRVVELAFAPLLDESEGASVKRVVVELAYEDVSLEIGGQVHRSPYPHAESFYRQIVSNYEQAAKWRVPRVRRPSAKSAQLAGRWLRITVGESGVFRVTGEDLQQAGIALDEVDPQTLRLLYGGGEALSEEMIQPPSAWKEMGLVVEDGGDSRFDPADYVLFYGEAAQRWEYDSEEVG